MKISCEIIRDLLPVYHDGVCSNESRQMIEEHLSECENCRAELKAMDDMLIIPDKKQNLAGAEAVKELSKKWKKGMFKSLLKGIFITLVVVILFILVLYLFMDIRIA